MIKKDNYEFNLSIFVILLYAISLSIFYFTLLGYDLKADFYRYVFFLVEEHGSKLNFEFLSEKIMLLLSLIPFKKLNVLVSFLVVISVIELFCSLFRIKYFTIFWILFLGICVLPFTNTINIRVGFALFFIIVNPFFYRSFGSTILPLFHLSLLPISLFYLINKLKLRYLWIILGFIIFILFRQQDYIKVKLLHYFIEEGIGHHAGFGFFLEAIIIISFQYEVNKIYSKPFFSKANYIFLFYFFMSIVTSYFDVTSSRFLTLSYLSIYLIILSNESPSVIHKKIFNFYFLGFILMSFRAYRVLTMLGVVKGFFS